LVSKAWNPSLGDSIIPHHRCRSAGARSSDGMSRWPLCRMSGCEARATLLVAVQRLHWGPRDGSPASLDSTDQRRWYDCHARRTP